MELAALINHSTKITMYDFFKKCSSNKVMYFFSELFCRFGKAIEIVDKNLPMKGCFFELKNDKIDNYTANEDMDDLLDSEREKAQEDGYNEGYDDRVDEEIMNG